MIQVVTPNFQQVNYNGAKKGNHTTYKDAIDKSIIALLIKDLILKPAILQKLNNWEIH